MSAQAVKDEKPAGPSRNVAYTSGAVIAVLLAYLTWQAFHNGSPASIVFEIATEEAWTNGPNGYVPIDVRNAGGSTASEIEIETRFEASGAEPVVKRTTLDFLAAGERRRFYAVGPPGAPLDVRLIGFIEP